MCSPKLADLVTKRQTERRLSGPTHCIAGWIVAEIPAGYCELLAECRVARGYNGRES